MDPVTILRGIATLLVNPALGGGGIGVIRGATLLNQLATLVEGGIETHKELNEFSKEIMALVESNGNPTRGQWDAMAARDKAARALIEANRKVLDGEQADDGHTIDPAAAKTGPSPGDSSVSDTSGDQQPS